VDAAEEVEAPGVEEGPPEVLDLAFGGALELPLSTRRMSASEVGRSQRVPDREMLRVVGLARVTFRQGALSREVVVRLFSRSVGSDPAAFPSLRRVPAPRPGVRDEPEPGR